MKSITLKSILLIAAPVFILACQQQDPVEAKREKLKSLKEEQAQLKIEITNLENELEELDTTIQDLTNVSVESLRYNKFEHFVDVTGSVETDMNVHVSPETSGNIVKIFVTEGERVSEGQVMARLNTNAIQRNIDEIKVNLDLANTTFERQKTLWDQNIGSEMEYLQAKSQKEALEQRLEALQAQLDMAIIKSPINGTVDDIMQNTGELAGPQIPFAKVVNISKLYVNADLAEKYLKDIEVGDSVLIDFSTIDYQVKAPITWISNIIDPNTRTFRIRIDIKNHNNLIKPNLSAVVKVRNYYSPKAIVVPSILVKNDFKGKYLYVAQKNGDNTSSAKKVYVETGLSENNNTIVLSGLEPDMLIITEGYAQVVDGTEIYIENI